MNILVIGVAIMAFCGAITILISKNSNDKIITSIESNSLKKADETFLEKNHSIEEILNDAKESENPQDIFNNLRNLSFEEIEEILNDAKESENPQEIFNNLRNLWFKISSRSDTKFTQLLDIYKILNSKIIHNNNIEIDEKLKTEVREFCEDTIRKDITIKAAEQLKKIDLTKNYHDSINFIKLLLEASEEIFNDATKIKIVGRNFSQSEVDLEANNFYQYPFPANLFSFLYLIPKYSDLSEYEGFSIATWIMFTKKFYIERNTLTEYTKGKIDKLWHHFPQNWKILFSAKHVCFRNNETNEYICRHPTSNGILHEDRQVGLCSEKSLDSFWKIYQPSHMIFKILYPNSNDEPMYVAKENKDLVRFGKYQDKNAQWLIKPDNDTFSIINDYHLSISYCSPKRSSSSSFTNNISKFTTKVYQATPEVQCRWVVENCEG